MTRASLPVVLLSALLVAGCGDSDEGTTPSSTFTAAAPSESVASSATAGESEPASIDIDLQDALLSIDDLPAGWAKEPDEEDEEDTTYCDYEQAHEPIAEAGAQFSTNADLLGVEIRQFDSEASATEVLDQLRGVLEECTEDEIDGTRVTFSLLSADQVGDDTVGVRLAGEAEGVEFTLDNVYVLRGAAILQVGLAGFIFAPSSDDLNKFAQLQLEKYDEAVQGA